MAYEELAFSAAIAAVLLAVGLWVATNLHLRYAKRALQSYGENARVRTEAFVSKELARVEGAFLERTNGIQGAISDFEKRVTAQLPPNVHDDVANLEGRLDVLITDLKGRFDESAALLQSLPERIRMVAMQERSVQARKVNEAAAELGQELEATVQSITPESVDMQSEFDREIVSFIRKPIDKKLEKENPIGATIQRFAKMGAAQYFSQRGGGSPSVTISKLAKRDVI